MGSSPSKRSNFPLFLPSQFAGGSEGLRTSNFFESEMSMSRHLAATFVTRAKLISPRLLSTE